MTDAAAVGLGYSPLTGCSPRSDSSASSVEEVALMTGCVVEEAVSVLTVATTGRASDDGEGSELDGGDGGEVVEFVTAAPEASTYRSIDEDSGGGGNCADDEGEEASGGDDASSTAGAKTEAPPAGPVVDVTTAATAPATANTLATTPSARGGKRAASDQLPSSSITPRRSKRARHKPTSLADDAAAPSPKTKKKAPVKSKATTKDHDGLEVHFDVIAEADEAAPHMQCKYCGRKLMQRKGASGRHLAACDAYKTRVAKEKVLAVKLEEMEADIGRLPGVQPMLETLGDVVTKLKPSPATSQHPSEDAEVSTLLWLFGSVENVDRMKTHYRRAPLALAAPVERLHALTRDYLSDLNVPKMLAARLAEALDGDLAVSQVVGSAKFKVSSVNQAVEMHAVGLSLSFPAPRRVADLLAAPLAGDMGFSRAGFQHMATVMVIGTEMALDWQLHSSETFVFMLQGGAKWKLQSDGAKYPLADFHRRSRSLTEAADAVKVLALAEGAGGHGQALVKPPIDDDDPRVFDYTDADGSVVEAAVGPGGVVYLPAGTWFAVETAADAVWLEVQLQPTTYEQAVLAALRPTLWRSDLWRAPLLLGGAQDGSRTAREQFDELLDELKLKATALTASDVLPECLLDGSGGVGPMFVEADLRKAFPFPEASRRLKITDAMEFRVNPAVVLLRADEVPQDAKAAMVLPLAETKAKVASSTHRKSKKKQERTQTPTRPDAQAYVLLGGFGNDAMEAKLRVKFRCSAAQAALVEWVRSGELLGEFSAMDFQAAGDVMEAVAAKRVLRFLWCIGFVSQVESEA